MHVRMRVCVRMWSGHRVVRRVAHWASLSPNPNPSPSPSPTLALALALALALTLTLAPTSALSANCSSSTQWATLAASWLRSFTCDEGYG